LPGYFFYGWRSPAAEVVAVAAINEAQFFIIKDFFAGKSRVDNE